MLSTKLKEAAGNSADATLYVNDVFSTYLYTGNGSTQTITNGIDLAGKGGLVWLKFRAGTNTASNELFDTVRGVNKLLISNGTQAENTPSNALNSFNSNGFTLGGNTEINFASDTYASWTFRKAAKFFDAVTYTGTGSARTIAHSLGVAPGMVIVKRTDTTGNWQVYHRSLTSAANSIQLNLTNAQASAPTVWNSTAPTSSVFSVGTDATVNASGGTYVAYLYAHDTSSTGIIQCGNYTGNGSATGPVVTLGWEPQYLMIKNASGTGNWQVIDSMRGMPVGSADATLQANLANAESSVEYLSPTATGFQITSTNTQVNTSGSTYIYMAIRRPNKPPTSGTQVFSPVASTSTFPSYKTDFPVDMAIRISDKDIVHTNYVFDRLRGNNNYLETNTTAAAVQNGTLWVFDYNTGWAQETADSAKITWNFKRAPGFFDEVCYTGTGSGVALNHNLTVIPQLAIYKARSAVSNWFGTYIINPLGGVNTAITALSLNSTSAGTNFNASSFGAGGFTSTTFPSTGAYDYTGSNLPFDSGVTYVAYLFATLAGISKVGSYTGNGSTGQAIACGFSAGARFVLIKRTDAAGNWYTFDSARGLTSGSSPYLLLNSTAAEVTGNNGVYQSTGGFTFGSTASTTTNINAATYIFLAVA